MTYKSKNLLKQAQLYSLNSYRKLFSILEKTIKGKKSISNEDYCLIIPNKELLWFQDTVPSDTLTSEPVITALLIVPREKFMDPSSRKLAYADTPMPIPGDGRQTISAPYMYPLVYEALNLKKGDIFLEVGAGSGYGAALAQEIVGSEGHVVAIEINQTTYAFAKAELETS